MAQTEAKQYAHKQGVEQERHGQVNFNSEMRTKN